MPDIKISQQAAIALLVVLCGAALGYGALSGKVIANETLGSRQQDELLGIHDDIDSLEKAEAKAALERQESRLVYKDIKDDLGDITDWIKTIELKSTIKPKSKEGI